MGVGSWVRKIPWAWQPTPVFLPGESHGQRSLAGYSPNGGYKESDMTEVTEYARMYIKYGQETTRIYITCVSYERSIGNDDSIPYLLTFEYYPNYDTQRKS